MKKFLLLVPAFLLAACAPSAGVRPTVYRASSAQILAYIGQVAPTIQPTQFNNYFSVTAITPTFITLRSTPVTGAQIFNAFVGENVKEGTINLTFTALESYGNTSVTHTTEYNNARIAAINQIYSLLDQRFQRVYR